MELHLTAHTYKHQLTMGYRLECVNLHYETVRTHIKTIEDTFPGKYFWGNILKAQR